MEILGLVDVSVSWLLVFVCFVLLYRYLTWHFDFFTKRGIPGPKPTPFFGNSTEMRSVHRLKDWGKHYGKIFGFFIGREPVFVISDLDTLKEILVKNFNNFRNRRKGFFIRKPLSLAMVFLEDAAWKRVRAIASPTFSAGKLRNMCVAINECASHLTDNFKKGFSKDSVDVKEYFGAYTMDVIARTAFGITVDSQNDFDNVFVNNAKRIFEPNAMAQKLEFIAGAFPFLLSAINFLRRFFTDVDFLGFFETSISEMVKQRYQEPREVRGARTDFLQLMMDAEVDSSSKDMSNGVASDKDNRKRLSMEELVAQGILFFIAGYETTASTLHFVSYSFAQNPKVQEKAYDEIVKELGDEEPNYDNIGKLKYLDNVITETLRMYPPVTAISRVAAETVNLGKVTIPKGCALMIPVAGLQRDPEHFSNPDEFFPDRHENKTNPLSFLSFGYGPRICIGMRLALVEAKIALVHVMRKLRFERGSNTPDQLKFRPLGVLAPEKPIMLKVKPRN